MDNKCLFRALTKDDVEVRVQSCNDKGFILLLYKNARVDQNILDETFGNFGWQVKYEEFKGNLYCSIGIKDKESGEWIWKANCGTESNTEKEKGEASDSMKRSGFCWGIGRELYTCPKIKINGNVKKDFKGKDTPIYYEFDVVDMQVSDTLPRKITKLHIIGKTMDGGKYREDTLLDFNLNKKSNNNVSSQQGAKESPKQELSLEVAKRMEVKTRSGQVMLLGDLDEEHLSALIPYKQYTEAVNLILESRKNGN